MVVLYIQTLKDVLTRTGPDLQVSVRLTFELSETGLELKDGSESLGSR